MFTHRSNIPVDFALSINFILHNNAVFEDWEVIDKQVLDKGLPCILEWIKSILEDNNINLDRISEEIEWWKKQVMKSEIAYKFNVEKSEVNNEGKNISDRSKRKKVG